MSLAAPVRRVTAHSASGARSALVAALTAAGCNGTPTAPDQPTAGAAWPAWVITNFDGHICDPSRHTFDCYVVLNAGDMATSVSEADETSARVAPALNGVGTVQSVEPVLITFGDGTTMPGVRFRVVTRA